MDPSSLFAPGGIVQGLSNLGNSIGDSFKSYALIRKERDDADMARTKMIFDAQDKLKQQELEQRRLDAQMQMWQGQQAADQQRIGLEGQRTAADVARSGADVELSKARLKTEETNAPLTAEEKRAEIEERKARTGLYGKQAEIAGKAQEEAVKVRREATAARLQGAMAAVNQKYVAMEQKIREAQDKAVNTAKLMAGRNLTFTEMAQIKARFKPQLDAIMQARSAELTPVHNAAKQEGLSLFDDGAGATGEPKAGLWEEAPPAGSTSRFRYGPPTGPLPANPTSPFRPQSAEQEDEEETARMSRIFGSAAASGFSQ